MWKWQDNKKVLQLHFPKKRTSAVAANIPAERKKWKEEKNLSPEVAVVSGKSTWQMQRRRGFLPIPEFRPTNSCLFRIDPGRCIFSFEPACKSSRASRRAEIAFNHVMINRMCGTHAAGTFRRIKHALLPLGRQKRALFRVKQKHCEWWTCRKTGCSKN